MSQAIVDFIGHLLPLYVEEPAQGVRCARSLQDGTLICPSSEMGDEFVTVYWQGDEARKSTVQAVFMASLAVARYVELRHLAERNKATRPEMEQLAQHFAFKTGESLVFEPPDFAFIEFVMDAAAKLGEEGVKEAIKKAVGL